VLEVYLPPRLAAGEMQAATLAIVAELDAKGPGDRGKLMGAAKARLAGKAVMAAVSAAVKPASAARRARCSQARCESCYCLCSILLP
jgi:hypothetical protein